MHAWVERIVGLTKQVKLTAMTYSSIYIYIFDFSLGKLEITFALVELP